jgi:hypothetical protein
MQRDPLEIAVHKEWLGQIQQVGLVVSPHVLARHGVGIERQQGIKVQTQLRELLSDADEPRINSFLELASEVLEWPEGFLAGTPGGSELADHLTVALPEYEDQLSPTYAIPDLALISVIETGAHFDKPLPGQKDGWRTSPQARLERLLRATGIPIGLLFNHTHLRLVYAPVGETSGHLTFRFKHVAETLGRPMAGALYALLGVERVTDVLADAQRLPALLKESRKYQNVVSTKLAEQVLEALWELLRGFQRANDDAKGTLLGEALRENPQEVYGGLLATLMRLVFVLYAEDREGLMPASEVYQKHYSLSGLFERLREDAARYPDTMDARHGAWAQLLVLFRLIHDGGGRGGLRFPSRRGRLFDPDAYPFLEGRRLGTSRTLGAPIDPPRVSDGVVFRVLQNLMILDGERLSYRTLDVEQIGSVYEAMMGFALQQAKGPSIAVSPKHIVVDLTELLEQKPKDRAGWLAARAELKIAGDALAKAATVDDVLAALGKKVSLEYTPSPLRAGAIFLQPNEERRRSGSHYTPRSLTEPIVRTTLGPIFERLGENATPEQILDLKVCDPTMGSGAFLVESCRLLADRLVKAWELHAATPKDIPPDEDATTFARRLVAERCLYGVDKNIFAVDLAKLSLWLATLARDHPFTFLDHALRHGDSLVGLSREQIACFNWQETGQLPLIRGLVDARVKEAESLRHQIRAMSASDNVPAKTRLLKEANEALDDVRRVADLVVAAFFGAEKPRDRETLRTKLAAEVQDWLSDNRVPRAAEADALLTFHWQIDFPEVFTRTTPGFDAFVGNPPFMGGSKISSNLGTAYLEWLLFLHPRSHGNGDLVAHFFRRCFVLLRDRGTFGLIATNTIAQGDTRTTGLTFIRAAGGTIFAARKRVKWPAGAAVVVSVVHVVKNDSVPSLVLDGKEVRKITAFLFHAGGDDLPLSLRENQRKAFLGSKIYGQGFTFDDADKSDVANPLSVMHELVRKDPRNAQRIFPYIGGEEVNESPTHAHHRYVINFAQMAEAEARRWPDLMRIVEAKVRPERQRLGDNPDAKRRKQYWWQWGRYTPALFDAIHHLDRVLACVLHQQHWSLVLIPAGAVFSHALGVFATDRLSQFGILQSRVHEIWARYFGSSLEDRFRYTPSDCFETFPFPSRWKSNEALTDIGRRYYEFRAALMVHNNEGLTKTYNRFHDSRGNDPDILELRDLHAAMDRVVLDAYGWTDIQPTCEFILDFEDEEDDTIDKPSQTKKPWRYRWPNSIRDEVIARLLELNAIRAREELHQGDLRPTTPKPQTRRKTPLLN